MDFAKLDTQQTDAVDMPLINPKDGTPLMDERQDPPKPITIKVLGIDSKEYTSVRHQMQNKALKKVGSGGKLKISAEQLEDQELSLLVAVTKGWSGIVIEGQEHEFNTANARSLYLRFAWIREQVNEFVNDRANFLGN